MVLNKQIRTLRPTEVNYLPQHHVAYKEVPGGSDHKESTCNVRDMDSLPGLGRPPGGGNGNPLRYSCLENPMDRGAWQATVQRVTESRAQLKRLSTHVLLRHDFDVVGVAV